MAKKNESTALAVKDAPGALSIAVDYGEDAGSGFEGMTQEDFKVPFLNVLQTNSPQLDESSGKYIEGAKAGMLHNSATDDVYSGKEGVVFVPCLTKHVYIEWRPRDAGGGFVGQHEFDSDLVAKAKAASTAFGKYTSPDGNQLVETFYIYAVVCDEQANPVGPVVIQATSMKIKPYKGWASKVGAYMQAVKDGNGNVVRKIRPPIFAHLTRMTTVGQKNAKGSFYNIKLDPARAGNGVSALEASLLDPKGAAFQAAKDFKALIEGGTVKVDHSSERSENQDSTYSDDGPAHF